MNFQTSKKGQRGQALILIALAAVGLFAFSAFAIDGSRSFSNKRHAQNAADTGALTAALYYIREPGNTDQKLAKAVEEAEKRVADNDFTHNGDTVIVDVDRCDDVTDINKTTGQPYAWDLLPNGGPIVCTGLPASVDTPEERAEYLRVRIVSVIPTTFGRVIGRQTLTAAAEAIARAQNASSSSTGGGFAGAAMVATNDDPNGSHCFLFNGNATLHTYNSGVFVNCGGDDAFFLNGSTQFTMEADSYVVGCKDGNPGYQVLGGHEIKCDQPKISVDASTYAGVYTMPSVPSCSGPGSYIDGGTHLTPGSHTNLNINKDTTMDDGIYCVSGSFNVNGQNKLSGGNVIIVLNDIDFNVGSQKEFTFGSLVIFTKNGTLDLKGSLKTNVFRFYSSGNGNVIINSGAYVRSGNAYMYLKNGNLRWNGDTDVELSAPTDSNDPAQGILVHMPWREDGTHQDLNLNGGSHALLHGTFLAPSATATYNGGTNFTLWGQIIAFDYKLDGNGDIEIHYVSSNIINPPNQPDSSIELSK